MNSKTAYTNLFWRFMERCGAQVVTFVVSVILARLLDPQVYGTVALVTVFTTVLEVFVDSGFASALIQKKDADNVDFSTVFFFNIFMCLMLYGIMFVLAPYIAEFYDMQELTSVIRVLCLIIVISGVKNVQQAYVARNMLFKRFFFSTLGGTIGAAVVGIAMAYMGYGVWALVVQMLFNTLVDTVILWFTVKWRPQLVFSWKRWKGLFAYGWKLFVSALLETAYSEARQLIIGKMYNTNDLAYYNRGNQLPNLIVRNINTSIDSVLLPIMANEQDDRERVKIMTRRAIKTSSYLMWPMMIGLIVCAEPIVRVVFTEKWLMCVPYLRIFCFTYAFYPIHTANLNAIKAMGRSDYFLYLEITKKVVGMLVILSTMWYGVMAMAYSLIITSVINQVINSWPNRKLLGYSYLEQLRDIMPSLLLSVVMGVCVASIQLLGWNDVVTLLVQVPSGVLIYIVGSRVFHLDSFEYILSMLRRKS